MNQLTLPGFGRDWRQDAALRPQPKRDGLDDWATPLVYAQPLCTTCYRDCRTGQYGREPAPGAGTLAKAMGDAGYRVEISTEDLQNCAAPKGARIMATNPPFNRIGLFIEHGLMLLDAGELDAVILLLRHDHLQSECQAPPHCRIDALNRVTQLFICPWRPFWLADRMSNPRWAFPWAVWERDAERRAPMWLKRRAAA